MKKCINCGTMLEDDAKFCSECGKSNFITEEPSPAPELKTDIPIQTKATENAPGTPKEEKSKQHTVIEPEKKNKTALIVITVLIALVLALVAGCIFLVIHFTKKDNNPKEIETPKTTVQAVEEEKVETTASQISESNTKENAKFSYDINLEGITTLEELEDRIDEDLSNTINNLSSQYDTLSTKIDTYEKYRKNADKISDFYETIVSNTEQMCIMLKEYTAAYARMVLDSDLNNQKKYNAIEGIEDAIYEDACGKILDEIYDGILEKMSNHFYNDVLDDQPDNVDWDDWYDISSNEYDQWYDASSGVYDIYYDTASDIYSFYSDMASELYDGDTDRAEKKYERFLQQIGKDKGLDTDHTDSKAVFNTALRTTNTTEELEQTVESHVSECVHALRNEWQALSEDINTFDKYRKNTNTIEEFHTHIEDSASQILVMICDYGIKYAEMILNSGISTKKQYNAFEDLRDCIYEDACSIVKDEIYEDLLKDVQKYYYDGIIKEGKDSVSYNEWSELRSDAYGWWSDARSGVYSAWADTRGDLYSFCSDVRGELYSGDSEGANKKLQRFQQKVEKMK